MRLGAEQTVRVTYAVAGATTQELQVDRLSEPALKQQSGTVTVRVHCDGVPHTVALIATDAHGTKVSKVKNLSTVLPAG